MCTSLLAGLWLCPLTHAQDEQKAEAKRLFEEGVARAAERDWQEAAELFTASLRHAEHPATRINLVLANEELGRPLEVVRNAWAFLDLPESEARPEVRQQVRDLLERATRALGALDLAALPAGSAPSIDGAPPDLVRGKRLYLTPGAHALVLRGLNGLYEKSECTLEAGVVRPWPRVELRVEPEVLAVAPPAQVGASVSRERAGQGASVAALRFRAAWVSGGLGAGGGGAALAVFAAARLLGEELARKQPDAAGYPSAADRYGRLKHAIAPLALGSGFLIATALALGPRVAGRKLGGGVGGLALAVVLSGLAGAWLAREPRTLITGTDVTRAVPEAGYLWLGAALPCLTFGVITLVARGRAKRAAQHSFLPLRWSW